MTQRSVPPRGAQFLLRTLLGKAEHEALVGDLNERYGQLAVLHGNHAARAYYWRETLAAIRSHSTHTRTPGSYPQGDSRMRHWLTDIGFASRTLRRAPTHFVVCVATLSLALGSMAAVISVVNPLLVQPLPYPDAAQLALVRERSADGTPTGLGFATYKDLATSAKSIEAAAVGFWQPTITGATESERVTGMRVSANYFRVLRVAPALGSDFLDGQDIPGTARVVMLSHGLWQRRFGGDSSIIGQAIDIAGTPHLVSGVMPRSYEDVLNPDAQIWRVLGYGIEQPFACRTCRHLRVLTRVHPGTSLASAEAEVNLLLKRMADAYPREYAAPGGTLTELREVVVARVRPTLLAVFGAIALILILAIVNVANLQLARTIRRGGEFAVRAALGAGRVQIARQLLAEALIIASVSTVLAIGIAYATTDILVSQLPPQMPRLAAIHVDVAAVIALVVTAIIVTLIIGFVPAWRIDNGSLTDALRTGQRGIGGHRRKARATLVVVEVAVAFVLVSGTGLLGQSLVRLLAVDAGFDASNVLTMEVQATGPRFQTDTAIFARQDAILAAVKALPGVRDAALANQLPLGGNTDRYGVNAEDKPLMNPELAPSADRYTVSTGYANTMKLRMIRGRMYTDHDNRDSMPLVAVVSAGLAKHIWGSDEVIGKKIRAGGGDSPWREVIGVVADVRHQGLNEEEPMQLYLPPRQWFFADNVLSMVVRVDGNPSAMTNRIVDAVRKLDPTQPVMNVASMETLVVRSTGQRRLALTLFGAFGVLALVLAGAGLYGMLSAIISERTREIGIRSALGATPRNIIGMVTRQALVLVATGSVIGIGGSLAIGRYLQSLLFEVAPADATTLAAAAGVALVMGVVAALVPATRALRIQPTVALTA